VNGDKRALMLDTRPQREAEAASAAVSRTLSEPGRPLPEAVRTEFEHRFGRPLTVVRIHDTPTAAAATRSVGADALTLGNHVLFGTGRWDPGSAAGRDLLAHELAHTVQQRDTGPPVARPRLLLSLPGSSLEREADAAAHAALSGPPGRAASILTTRPPAPHVARRQITWAPIPGDPVTLENGDTVSEWETESDRIARFKVPKLVLPAAKGPVLDHYKRAVKGGGESSGLETTIEFDGSRARAGLWEARAPTADLNRRWLIKVGWDETEANKNWYEAGGKKGTGFPTANPGVASSTCDMDHIIELQLGGSNTPSNIAPLNSKPNRESGRELWRIVSGTARLLRPKLTDTGKVNVILSFQDVDQQPPVPMPTGCKSPGAPDCTCSDLDVCAMEKSKAEGAAAGTTPYNVTTGVQNAMFAVIGETAPVDLQADEENRKQSELIPGMILQTLQRPKKGHQLKGFIESRNHPKRSSKTRLPLILDQGGDEVTLDSKLDGGDVYRLTLAGSGKKKVKFTYPYLSAGTLELKLGDKGLEGAGTLDVTNPLFKGLKIDVYLREGEFGGTVNLDPKQMKPPIPGLKIKTAKGEIQLAPELSVAGDVEFGVGRLIEGNLHAEPTLAGGTPGVYLKGGVKANIPKVENASGEVEYRNSQLTGKIEIATGKLSSLPGKPRGLVVITLSDKGFEPSGELVIDLPRGGSIEGKVRRGGPYGFIVTGNTKIDLPGLKPVTLAVTYDGQDLSGKVKAPVDFKGLTGEITVAYDDGRFSGDAWLAFSVSRFSGKAHIFVSPKGLLHGEGTVSAPITKTIIATLTVKKPEVGDWEVVGELQLPPAILLFPPVKKRDTVFDKSFSFNIWGPVVLRINPSIGYDVGVGPGLLNNLKVQAGFKPFAEENDFEVQATGALYIAGWALLTGGLEVGLGLGAGRLGSITGNLGLDVEAGVKGKVDAPFAFHYKAGRFSAKTDITIAGGFVLITSVYGKILVEAVGFEVWSKRWDLGKTDWDLGLSMKIIIPISYASDTGFVFPSWSDCTVEKPKFDFDALEASLTKKLDEWAS
jgi:hypothetical protein